jgi:hypothetical protein
MADCRDNAAWLRQKVQALRIPTWLSARRWTLAIPVLLGLFAGVWVTGGAMLWPGQVAWLAHGDLAQSYLGWAFYRHAPWAWPPGANPAYGAGLHSSIYYSDSIPLLALLLKPLSAWLPEPFQYFGLWVLACFVLQAVFAWRLLGLAESRPLDRALGTMFFVLAPPMLNRLGGHMALVGQWMILAALWLNLRPSRRCQSAWWTALIAAAMIVHAYLFAMVAAVWVADVAQRQRDLQRVAPVGARDALRRWLPELVPVVAATCLAAWLAGFFMVSGHGMQAEGFGYYKMNLLAPFDGDGWSRFGLRLAQAPGEYEGFNYLGLGGIALVAVALLAAVLRRGERPPRMIPVPLVIVAALLAALAVTCNVGFGAWQWHMPLPQRWWAKLSHLSLQSTGRMFWVAYYLILLAALFAVSRRLRGPARTVLLLALLVLQLVDLYPGLSGMRATLLARARSTPASLHGTFWDAAGERYRTLRQLPLALMSPGWETLASYAQEHRMRTDAVQLARIDWPRFLSLYNHGQAALLDDRLDPDTLYVLDDGEVAVARMAIPAGGAALFRLDGRNVLAPGWSAALPAGAVDLRGFDRAKSPFRWPFHDDLAAHGPGRRLLGEGWNSTAAGAVSTRGDHASLFVPVDGTAGQVARVELDLRRDGSHKPQARELEVWSGTRRVGGCAIATDDCRRLRVDVPLTGTGPRFQALTLRPAPAGVRLRVVLQGIRVAAPSE